MITMSSVWELLGRKSVSQAGQSRARQGSVHHTSDRGGTVMAVPGQSLSPRSCLGAGGGWTQQIWGARREMW